MHFIVLFLVLCLGAQSVFSDGIYELERRKYEQAERALEQAERALEQAERALQQYGIDEWEDFEWGGRMYRNDRGTERGNRDIITVDRPVSSSFERIVLKISGEVRIYQSEEAKVSVTTDSNLEKYIQTEIKNGVLEIKTDRREGLRPSKNIITVYMPVIAELDISGSGTINFMNKISGEALRRTISCSGEIQGELEYNNLFANIRGSGGITLTGKSQKAELDISGSGAFECLELEAQDVIVKISGSGNTRVNAINNLTGRISGAGNIVYKGSPKITYSGSGSGTLKTLD